MTPEEIAALIAKALEEAAPKFAQLANDAATAHSKRLTKDFEAKLASLTPQTPAEEPAPQGKSSKQTPADAAKDAKLDEYIKRLEEAEGKRIAAENKARDNSAFAALKDGLKSVREDMRDIAAERLFHVQKRVTFDPETGEPLFKMRRAPAAGLPEEEVELPLSSGIEHWLKSKDAAPFVAAPASGGNTGRGARAPMGIPSGRGANGMPTYDQAATTDDERVARAGEMERAILAAQKNMGL